MSPVSDSILAVLKAVALEIRPCKRCNQTIYICANAAEMKASSSKRIIAIAFQSDGKNHFGNCNPAAAQTPKTPTQQALLDVKPTTAALDPK